MRLLAFLRRGLRDTGLFFRRTWLGWAIQIGSLAAVAAILQIFGKIHADADFLKAAADQWLPLLGFAGVALGAALVITFFNIWRAPYRIVREQRDARRRAHVTSRGYIADNIAHRKALFMEEEKWRKAWNEEHTARATDAAEFSRRFSNQRETYASVVSENERVVGRVAELEGQLRVKTDEFGRRRAAAIGKAVALEAVLLERAREAGQIARAATGVSLRVGGTLVLTSPIQAVRNWFQNVRNDLFQSEYLPLLTPSASSSVLSPLVELPYQDGEAIPWMEAKVEVVRKIADRLRDDAAALRRIERDQHGAV